MKFKLIITTPDSKINAQNISEELVERQLSPCVQILPNITSIYRWQKKIERGKEYLILIKVLEKHIDSCKTVILKKHNYEIPEIITVDAKILNKNYSDWFLNIHK